MSERPKPAGSRLTSNTLMARNVYINIIGQVLPIPAAIVAVPLLVKDMGTDRFGVLALAWVVMSYFGLFDFGMGRATTRFVAEHHARDDLEALPPLVWSSVLFHACLGVLGGGLLAGLTPWLTGSFLNIPAALTDETRTTFYLLAVSVPLVVTTAALRGVLEATQRFDMINVVKVPASMLNYLGPLPILVFTDSLVAVVGVLVFSRSAELLAHLFFCLRALPVLSSGFRFNAALLRPLLSFGGWLTASTFMGPSIASIDRFIIGASVSLSAVALYTTPYEVITKLTIFSASLLSVLFPTFSALNVNRAHELRRLYLRALKYLLVLVAPIVGVLLALSYDLLSLWVTPEFARDSAPVAKWLAIGILIIVLAQVPVTALQGAGRADITAKLQLAQLPFYALAVWYLAGSVGIVGVAVAWMVRAAVDAVLLFVAADKLLPLSVEAPADRFFWPSIVVVCGFLLLFLGIGSESIGGIVPKLVATGALLGAFMLWEWLFFLGPADRRALVKSANLRKGASE